MAVMVVATDNDGFEAAYLDGHLAAIGEPIRASDMARTTEGLAVTIEHFDVACVYGDEWPATLHELQERMKG